MTTDDRPLAPPRDWITPASWLVVAATLAMLLVFVAGHSFSIYDDGDQLDMIRQAAARQQVELKAADAKVLRRFFDPSVATLKTGDELVVVRPSRRTRQR